MTQAAAFLRDLRARGAVLRVEGDRLQGDAPRGVLTAEARAQLVAFKAELLALLRAEAEPATITVADVVAIFGARVVTGAPRGLRCGVCGGGDWRPAAQAGWVECIPCAAKYPPRAAPEWRDAAGVDYAVLC